MAIGSFLFVFLQALLLPLPLKAAHEIPVAVVEDVLLDYQAFVQDRDPRKITSFEGKNSRRDVVELILFQQALAHARFEEPVRFVSLPSTGRILEQLRIGKVVAVANSVWAESVADTELLKSAPLIQDDEFIVGIYTRPSNKKLLQAKFPQDFPKFSAVTNPDWGPDLKALKDLKVGRIYEVSHWELMPKMVNSGRVDFTLAPFRNTPDKHFVFAGNVFVPVRSYKVHLKGTRHWVTSKKHPAGEKLHKALEKGRAALVDAGIVQKAYRESGFYPEDIREWSVLNR